jgi:hypothetical protein
MEKKLITLELTEKQYNDLVKLVFLGGMVTDEVSDDEALESFTTVQQKVFAASGPAKGNLYIAYDNKEDEYFLAEDLENELTDILDEYDESRFWESLVMRLALRDLQKKFSEKELKEMPDEKGSKEMEIIHNYYLNEFDDNDLDNLKVVSMKKV